MNAVCAFLTKHLIQAVERVILFEWGFFGFVCIFFFIVFTPPLFIFVRYKFYGIDQMFVSCVTRLFNNFYSDSDMKTTIRLRRNNVPFGIKNIFARFNSNNLISSFGLLFLALNLT